MAANKISVTQQFNTKEDAPSSIPQLDIAPNSVPEEEQVVQKSPSISKAIINASYILFALVGLLACTSLNIIDIDKYIKFLENFSSIWAPLVFTVGAGRAAKNYLATKNTSKKL